MYYYYDPDSPSPDVFPFKPSSVFEVCLSANRLHRGAVTLGRLQTPFHFLTSGSWLWLKATISLISVSDATFLVGVQECGRGSWRLPTLPDCRREKTCATQDDLLFLLWFSWFALVVIWRRVRPPWNESLSCSQSLCLTRGDELCLLGFCLI